MFRSRLTAFAMCVTILMAENSEDSSELILAQAHAPKHFCEGSTPFLKHACYEQCLLWKGRAQWEAACPGGSCCVQGWWKEGLGHSPRAGEQNVPFNWSLESCISLPHPFLLISAIPLKGVKHSQARIPLHKVRSQHLKASH